MSQVSIKSPGMSRQKTWCVACLPVMWSDRAISCQWQRSSLRFQKWKLLNLSCFNRILNSVAPPSYPFAPCSPVDPPSTPSRTDEDKLLPNFYRNFRSSSYKSISPESGKGSSEGESRFFRRKYPSTGDVSAISHRAPGASEGTSSGLVRGQSRGNHLA